MAAEKDSIVKELRVWKRHQRAGWITGGMLAGIVAFGLAQTTVAASAAYAATASAQPAPGAAAEVAAQKPVPGVPAKVVALIGELTGGKEQVTGTRPGPDGLTGVVAEGRKGTRLAGTHTLFWLLPGDKLLSLGPMFNLQGQNITQIAMQNAGLLPHNHTSLAAWKPGSPQRAVIETLVAGKGFSGFTQGHGPNRITAFIDPNCIFCHKWWERLQATKGWQDRFTVHWIPVGFLKPSSPGKAASLLAGGVHALSKDERHFDVKTESGGLTKSDNKKLLAEVKTNTQLWHRSLAKIDVLAGTPTLVTGAGRVFAGDQALATLEAHKPS